MARYEPRDRFYRKAKAKGLPSRAAFKIEELLARYALARSGSRILDLGSAPGGWLAILRRAAGRAGRVVGIDLAACGNLPEGVITIQGDIREPATIADAVSKLGGQADLVTSDLSPKLTGIKVRDQALSGELNEAALHAALAVLRPGGSMVAKLFMGTDFKQTAERFRPHFSQVIIARTDATRPGSSELYLVARNFRPPSESSSDAS